MSNSLILTTKRIITILLLMSGCYFFSVRLISADNHKLQRPFTKEATIWLDFDMQNIPEPQATDIRYGADFVDNSLVRPLREGFRVTNKLHILNGHRAAYNVNNLDEVPNSSWFTNRNGLHAMSIAEIKLGPNKSNGPQGEITIIKGKSDGATPGLTVRDQVGDTYILKFDPVDYPEMASAAEVISTKLFYAIGYNVPENYIYRFNAADLKIDSKATYNDPQHKQAPLTEDVIKQLLSKAARQTNGQYRCVASKIIKGSVKGGFKFFGKRADDANDLIPHEDRRDLRGLRIFSAWLNHNDMRAENSLDVYVTEQNRKFLRHYLIDFGSTLGSETTIPNHLRAGHEYNLDYNQSTLSLITFGVGRPKYLHEDRELHYPSVGFYSVEEFEPEKWKPVIPQAAFDNLTDNDAFWAARIVAAFTDDQIRAAVETGELSDPQAQEYLTQQIIGRRDKIINYYFPQRAGFSDFKIENLNQSAIVRFEDLRVTRLQQQFNKHYRYSITSSDDKQLLGKGEVVDNEINLSAQLLAAIATCGEKQNDKGVAHLKIWRDGESKQTSVYLFNDQGLLKIVGLEY